MSTDPAELLKRLKKVAARVPAGMWITATDWGAFAGWKRDAPAPPVIDLAAVDAITPHHPVLFRRYDRAYFANSEALRLARVRETATDPKGGRYGRDPSTGKLNGMLFGTVGEQIELMLPPSTAAKKRIGALGVIEELNRFGITSIQDIARLDAITQQQIPPIFTERSYSDVGIFRDLKERGQLHVRVYAFMPLQTWGALAKFGIRPNSGDELLRYGILKDFTDGSLMFEPYSNNPRTSGNWTFRFPGEEIMAKNIADADRAGFDIGLHVTGDKAFHAILDWYDAAARQNGPRDRRHRLIHAWYAKPEDLDRAGKDASDRRRDARSTARTTSRDVEGVGGPERAKTAFAWRIHDPRRHEARHRLRPSGTVQQAAGGDHQSAGKYLHGDHAPTLGWDAPGAGIPSRASRCEEAIEAYTINPAYASHEEKLKGTLTEGKLADLVVLSNDILQGAAGNSVEHGRRLHRARRKDRIRKKALTGALTVPAALLYAHQEAY